MRTSGKNEGRQEIIQETLPRKAMLFGAILFLATLLLGITNGQKLSRTPDVERITMPIVSIWQFVYAFFVATIIVLFIAAGGIKFKKGRVAVFKVFFIFSSLWGGLILLAAWLPDTTAFVIMTLLIFWWLKTLSVLAHNLVIILGFAGIGSQLGLSMEPETIILLLVVFSIYDFIAVYKTKHMIKMAKAMMESGVIFALIIPQEISGFKMSAKEVSPGGKFLILGGGDIIFPMILAVSSVPSGFLNALLVVVFALIGLLVNCRILSRQKERRPIPALPAIAAFSIAGHFLAKALVI